MQYARGERYRLERGKGVTGFDWWVYTLNGEEVVGGLPYADARRHFEELEDSFARAKEKDANTS